MHTHPRSFYPRQLTPLTQAPFTTHVLPVGLHRIFDDSFPRGRHRDISRPLIPEKPLKGPDIFLGRNNDIEPIVHALSSDGKTPVRFVTLTGWKSQGKGKGKSQSRQSQVKSKDCVLVKRMKELAFEDSVARKAVEQAKWEV